MAPEVESQKRSVLPRKCVMCSKRCSPFFTFACHVVCTPCLTLLVQYRDPDDVIMCPVCHRVYPMDDTWKRHFNDHVFALRNDQSSQAGITRCGRCRRGRGRERTVAVAQHFCYQCCLPLCPPCHVTVHVYGLPAERRRHHVVLPLLPEPLVLLGPQLAARCPVHADQPQAVYCVTCCHVTCWDCADFCHNGHALWAVQDHLGRYQEALEQRLIAMLRHRQLLLVLHNVLATTLHDTHAPAARDPQRPPLHDAVTTSHSLLPVSSFLPSATVFTLPQSTLVSMGTEPNDESRTEAMVTGKTPEASDTEATIKYPNSCVKKRVELTSGGFMRLRKIKEIKTFRASLEPDDKTEQPRSSPGSAEADQGVSRESLHRATCGEDEVGDSCTNRSSSEDPHGAGVQHTQDQDLLNQQPHHAFPDQRPSSVDLPRQTTTSSLYYEGLPAKSFICGRHLQQSSTFGIGLCNKPEMEQLRDCMQAVYTTYKVLAGRIQRLCVDLYSDADSATCVTRLSTWMNARTVLNHDDFLALSAMFPEPFLCPPFSLPSQAEAGSTLLGHSASRQGGNGSGPSWSFPAHQADAGLASNGEAAIAGCPSFPTFKSQLYIQLNVGSSHSQTQLNPPELKQKRCLTEAAGFSFSLS